MCPLRSWDFTRLKNSGIIYPGAVGYCSEKVQNNNIEDTYRKDRWQI